jgi:hypothetical protein
MRSKLTLLSTAAALAFGLTATAALAADTAGDAPGAKSDITIVGTDTGNAPATGVEESTESQGATNKQGLNESGAMPPAIGAGSEQGGGALSSDSAQSEGATNSPPRIPALPA